MEFITVFLFTMWQYSDGLSCADGEWACLDGRRCIGEEYVCSGNIDCGFGSDEDPVMCTQWNCSARHWKCHDNLQCIDEKLVCDGDPWNLPRCNDGSDEDPAMCPQWNCTAGYWKCKDDPQCISVNNVCDGLTWRSCRDKSDEDPVMCAQWSCPSGYWKCDSGVQCISESGICNGWPSCRDNSDENMTVCAQYNCTDGYSKCKDGLQCVPNERKCDGNPNGPDCLDESDDDSDMCLQWDCPAGYWKCQNKSRCIQESQVCDGFNACRDYGDGSDEDPAMCSKWTCPAGLWKCHSGLQCLPEIYMCDKSIYSWRSCSDGSDEDPAMCSIWKCPANYWKCNDWSMECIETEFVCDGHYRCYDNSDEHNQMCGCPKETEFPCHDGHGCVDEQSVCDGIETCRDGSDELQSVCQSWSCSLGLWKCGDLTCKPLCDGKADCNDTSDEKTNFCISYNCPPGNTKCADQLQCIKTESICDDSIDCKDGSDELCNDFCLKSPLMDGERTIIRRCDEDSSVCLPVDQYCDGIAQCPDGSDEIQSDCSCEDWGLKSCNNERNPVRTNCLNIKWITTAVNQSALACLDVVNHIMETQIDLRENDTDNCVMVSPEGTDELQCMNYSSDNPCKSINYAINHGSSSICLFGTFYNISENIDLSYIIDGQNDGENEINVFCHQCRIIKCELLLSSNADKIYSIVLRNFDLKESTISLSNVDVTFSKVTLENTLIQDLMSAKGYNQIQFEDSTIYCFEHERCGLFLGNTSTAKVRFAQSQLTDFRIDISLSQLILVFYKADITMPHIKVQTNSLEYLKIPTIIQFDQVTVLTETDIPLRVKRNVESQPGEDFVRLYITNPYVIIQDSHFIDVSLEILSRRQHFEPVSFSLLIEQSYFFNSSHIGGGGALRITSQVRNSEVLIVNSRFSNNSALKGMGNLRGLGGGVYVESQSLKLIITDSIFVANTASDSGLSLYTTEGVHVLLLDCTFEYTVDPNAPIQQSIVFVSGKMIDFKGIFNIFHPKPELYLGPIDAFYFGQGEHLEIKVNCPRWHNHIIEYSSGFTISQAIPDAHYKCNPCSDNYYTTGLKNNTLHYSGKENVTLVEQLYGNKIRGCIQCEYGALCTGNNVIPRPNYWGYWLEGQLAFQQCPAGYCCSGSDSSICTEYDYCSGNRTGTLCGACQEGFSVSILTGSCTLDSLCGGDQWFWLVALLATMAYAMWYTLKDDIFSLFFGLIAYVKGARTQSKVRVNVSPERMSTHSGLSHSKFEDNISNSNVLGENDNLEENASLDDVDKGYFGIVTYYVQMAAVITIQIEFSDIDKSESFLDKIVNNIGRFLNIELTQMPFDVCPVIGLTTVGKHLYKLAFLFGIYVAWAGFFLIVLTVITLLHKQKWIESIVGKLESFRLKLIRGVIEIIKYTYAGFCGIIFMSLVCVPIGKKYVWLYDGTNICLENWQTVIVIFAICYAVPFPLMLVLGLKLLKQNKISPAIFVWSCLFPIVAIYFMLIYACLMKGPKIRETSVLSEESEAVISVLQGPYREDQKHLTLYWEAMVSARRLLITGMTLVSYASIRMIIIALLNLIFLVQHNYMSPFEVKSSNYVESLSLLLLSLTSMINLLKASLTDSAVVPSGPAVPFFKSLELCEKMFVLVIIAYILLVEVKSRQGKNAKQNAKH